MPENRSDCGEEQQEREPSGNFKKYGFDLNLFVALSSGAFIILFCVYAVLNLERAFELSMAMQAFITSKLDWVFIFSSNFIVIACFFLAFSKLGRVRIGGAHCEKEFGNFSWYSMLISAGMGIGLMFWAVGEPLSHFHQTPPIFGHPEASFTAMATTFFHWGLHPWGIYALMALALAFFAYNRKMPLSLRSVFYFLFKERVYGRVGDVIDTFAVLSVLFGLATSLALGVQQINSGLDYLLGISVNVWTQIVLITAITLIAVASIVKGLHKGIRFFAALNMRLALIFMLAVFFLGPTGYILRLFSNSLGLYFNSIIQYSSYLGAEGEGWQGTWTIPFLAWWIAWCPFVGMFIARISKGRTVRELITGVLIVPSMLSFFWLSVFGGAAINSDRISEGALFSVVEDNLPVALFELVSMLNMPFASELLRVLVYITATALVVNYFITSSDSGSLVVDKISSGGKIKSPTRQRVFWAAIEGLLAATLLLIGGDRAIDVLRTAVTAVGLPLAVIMTLMIFSLIKGLDVSHEKQMWIKDSLRIKKILKKKKEAGGGKSKKQD